jgi:hypothetical protein
MVSVSPEKTTGPPKDAGDVQLLKPTDAGPTPIETAAADAYKPGTKLKTGSDSAAKPANEQYLDLNTANLYAKGGDQNQSAGDALKKADTPDNTVKDVATEKSAMLSAAEKSIKDPTQLKKFENDIQQFEKRGSTDKLAPSEVAGTYHEITQLLEPQINAKVNANDRQQLAEQVMHHAADPDSVRQGDANTCAVASVEMRTYSLYPSAAAKLVTDVALTGQYKASDGTTVTTDPTFHPSPSDVLRAYSKDPDAQEIAKGDNIDLNDHGRDHASEIFQVTAVNLNYAKENASTNPPGQLKYVQNKMSPEGFLLHGDTGEGLYDYAQLDANGKPKLIAKDPKLDEAKTAIISNMITGHNESDVVIKESDDPNEKGGNGLTVVHNQAELAQKLKQLSAENKPVLVNIDTNVEPFYSGTNHGATGEIANDHLIVATGTQNGQVNYYNPWGKDGGKSANKTISLPDLNLAAEGSDAADFDLQIQNAANKASGNENSQKVFEDLRLQFQLGDIDEKEYKQDFADALKETQARWKKEKQENPDHQLTPAQKKEEKDGLIEIANSPTSTPEYEN